MEKQDKIRYLLDQFSFVYNPPSTCWMYMPLLIISEGFTPIPI